MKIEHVAIWTPDLERLRKFYEKYFQAKAGQKYTNPKTQFESYFLTFTSGARLELMHTPTTMASPNDFSRQSIGRNHIAFSVGSKERVIELTALLVTDGYRVIDGPRQTGDDYFESCILDPDGNRVEITI